MLHSELVASFILMELHVGCMSRTSASVGMCAAFCQCDGCEITEM